MTAKMLSNVINPSKKCESWFSGPYNDGTELVFLGAQIKYTDKRPRFSISVNLCRNTGFLQGSAKIVALNLEESYRSAESLQI